MSLSLLFSLFFLSLLIAGTTSVPHTIGVTYNPTPHPSPDHVASTIQSLKITAVRLPNPDPSVVRAFSYSNISLLLSIPNSLVPSIASNLSAAQLWLYTHVVPFYPRAKISTISVGSDVLDSASDLSDLVLPALRNIHRSLRDLGIRKISVSTTFTFRKIITSAFPPSNAEFQSPAADVLISPLLDFLAETNSSFLVNLYPYSIYGIHSEIPIGFALFQEHPFNFRDDVATGVRYRNLFDAMVDSVISAMAVAGHENIPVIVTETGWPSSGNDDNHEAIPVYANLYIRGLVDHLNSGIGTPLRKEGVAETYIYELLDREGNETGQQHWGILYPNLTNKYDIEFSAAAETFGGSGGLVGILLVVVGVLILY